MATFQGHIPNFSGVPDDWEIYTEQLTHYFTASGNDDADKKRAILLSTCGTAAYKLLKTLVAPANLSTMSFEDLVKKALEHYNPQPSMIMRRFKFNSSVRQQGESVANFVSRLRDLASNCEYGDSAKELIRDRLVCGIRDDRLQRTLLAVPKLTFEKAFELALLHESAEQNAQMLRAPVEVHVTSTPAPNATGRDRPTYSRASVTVAAGNTWQKCAGLRRYCAITAARRAISSAYAVAGGDRLDRLIVLGHRGKRVVHTWSIPTNKTRRLPRLPHCQLTTTCM